MLQFMIGNWYSISEDIYDRAGRHMLQSVDPYTTVHVVWCFWHPGVHVGIPMAHPWEGGRRGRGERPGRDELGPALLMHLKKS